MSVSELHASARELGSSRTCMLSFCSVAVSVTLHTVSRGQVQGTYSPLGGLGAWITVFYKDFLEAGNIWGGNECCLTEQKVNEH